MSIQYICSHDFAVASPKAKPGLLPEFDLLDNEIVRYNQLPKSKRPLLSGGPLCLKLYIRKLSAERVLSKDRALSIYYIPPIFRVRVRVRVRVIMH